jgi:hypothetical protein
MGNNCPGSNTNCTASSVSAVPYTISEEQKHKNDETRERLLRSGEFSGIPKQERNICRVLTRYVPIQLFQCARHRL